MPNENDYLVTSADTRKKKKRATSGDFQPLGATAERLAKSHQWWKTPRRRAIGSAAINHQREVATEIVDLTLDILADPDDEMLAAGAEELAHALPSEAKPTYRRDLAGVIWRAMLHRART